MTRTKLGYGLKEDAAYQLRDIAAHLKSQRFDPEKEYFEFLIKGEIKAHDIKTLLTLPYEVSIEGEHSLILSTGDREGAANEEHISRRRNNGRIAFHTHPYYKGNFQGAPSGYDAVHSWEVKDIATLSLAHSGGIIIYRRSFLDPETKKLINPDEDFFSVFKKYAALNRIGLGAGEIPENPKGFYDKGSTELNEEESFRFFRQFAEQTGMIVDEATWGDNAGLERVVAKAFEGIQQ